MLGFTELLVKEVKLTPKKSIISAQESSGENMMHLAINISMLNIFISKLLMDKAIKQNLHEISVSWRTLKCHVLILHSQNVSCVRWNDKGSHLHKRAVCGEKCMCDYMQSYSPRYISSKPDMPSPCVGKPLCTSHYTDREKMMMGLEPHITYYCFTISALRTPQQERNAQKLELSLFRWKLAVKQTQKETHFWFICFWSNGPGGAT